jgi:hypothetical protein
LIEWTYAHVDEHCGGCRNTVAIGDPIQLTHISGVKRALIRCEECAGPAPEDMPPFVLPEPPQLHDAPQPPPRKKSSEWMPYRDE